MLPLWRPLTHASVDASAHCFLSEQAFNVSAELGEVFRRSGGWIALYGSINDGLRKIGIEVAASSLSDENRRTTIRAIMLAVSGP